MMLPIVTGMLAGLAFDASNRLAASLPRLDPQGYPGGCHPLETMLKPALGGEANRCGHIYCQLLRNARGRKRGRER